MRRLPAGAGEQGHPGQHRRPPGELRRRRGAVDPVRLYPLRRGGGGDRPAGAEGEAAGGGEGGGKAGHRRAHPPGRGEGAPQAGP